MEEGGHQEEPCRLEETVGVLAGKWKSSILWIVKQEPARFGELRRQLPGITTTTLTRTLRELERDGLISRRQYPEVPPRVEYSETELAASVDPVLNAIDHWGRRWMDSVNEARERYDVNQKPT